MRYFLEIKNNNIVGKLKCDRNTILSEDFMEISEDYYDVIKLPFAIEEYPVRIDEIITLQSLTPSKEEIEKAELAIEILSILQEVL